MLPSLHNLPLGVNATNGKVANVPNHGRLADLPLELWQRIEHFLVEDCSLDSLLGISGWCRAHSKVCDDQWSKDVLETCFGARPVPVVPSTPDTDMIRRMGLDIFDSNGKPVVALGGGFWHRMLLQCVSELEQLPPLMSAAYLRSNEAQRARWASVFKHRGMCALRARVVLADAPDPAPEKDDELDVGIDAFWQRDDYHVRIDFMRGDESTAAFEDAINKWIEEGWKFDWLLGSIFRDNVDTKEDWATNDIVDPDGQLLSVDAWTSRLMDSQYKFFIPRMHMLLQHGINPVIKASDLNLTIPNVRRMKREDHVQLEVLSSNIKFITDNNIKIEFDNPVVSMIMRAIGNAYVDLPYAIDCWEHELKPDSSQQLLDTNTESTYTEHFRRYKETVPRRLVKLMVHLAHPHGSNAWEAAHENTMSHFLNGGYLFFTEEHERDFRMALFETGGNVETDPIFKIAKPREWPFVDHRDSAYHYDDAVEQLVSGPSKSFITRVQELLDQNKKPVLNPRDLNLLIPNVRGMKLNDHDQLEVLSCNIQFIVDKKIKIVFDSNAHTSENPSVRMIVRAIGNAYVDLPYALERWANELKPDRRQWELEEDDGDHCAAFLVHSCSYGKIVPQRLVQLMKHLAHPHGSNAWEAVRENTMSHFVNGGYLFFNQFKSDGLKNELGEDVFRTISQVAEW